MQIRSARIEDIDTLSELAMRSKAHWGYSKAFMEQCREELSVTAEKLQNQHFHYEVAESGGQILGFYALECLSRHQYELEALFVDPEQIGSGVGRQLMASAIAQASGLGGHSMIIQGDPHAEKFYLSAGCKPIGERESESIPGRYLPLFKLDLTRA